MKKSLFVITFASFIGGFAHATNSCTGATYYDAASDTCIACPTGYDYNTDAGKDDITDCQIHCNAGTYVGSVGSPLPYGYTQLEYVGFTATQTIDTGISGLDTGNWEIYTKWMMTGTPANYGKVVSAYTNEASNTYRIIAAGTSSTTYYINGNSKAQGSRTVDLALNQIHEGLIENGSVTIDGTVYNTPTQGNSISGSSTILFSKIYGQIYSSWAKKDGVYEYNVIPARRNSDGVVGMYDTVSGTFFTNSGTGTFTAGADIGLCVNVGAGYYAPASTVNYGSTGTRTACPVGTYSDITNGASISDCQQCTGATYNDTTGAAACIACPTGYDYNTDAGKDDITDCQIHCNAGTYVGSPLPYGYTQLEYIESTGTQYIDTGFTHNSANIRGEIRVGTSTDMATNLNILGNQTSSAGYSVGWAPTVFKVWVVTSGTRLNGPTHALSAGTTHDIEFELTNNTRKLKYDGATVSGSHMGGIVTSNSIYLFDNGLGQTNQNFKGRIYYVKIYEDGVLAHNFLPMRRNSDGVIGVVDSVTGRFSTNAGTGTFISGPVVNAQCADVGAGYYAPASTVNYGSTGTRTACPVGTYSDITNGASISDCQQCTGATYNDTTGAAACIACPTGYDYNTDAGKDDITDCQIHCNAGTYVGSPLPYGYTQLEYIESTGTQYIVSPITSIRNGVFYLDFQMVETPDTGFPTIWGAMSGSSDYKVAFGSSSQKLYSQPGNGAGYTDTIDKDTNRHQATITTTETGETIVIDGQTFSNSFSITADDSLALTLFARNRYDGMNNFAKLKLYLAWHKNANNEYDFYAIPVKDSTGTIGMYDTVSGTFFTNSGTGTFTAGADISNQSGGLCVNVGAGYYAPASTVNYGSPGTRTACPLGYNYNATPGDITQCQIHCDGGMYIENPGLPGYKRLEYIQSDGNVILDTGYILQENDVLELHYKLMPAHLSKSGDKFLLRATNTWVETYGSTNTWYTRFGSSSSVNGSFNSTTQTEGVLVLKKNSLSVNGTKILSPAFNSTLAGTTLKIFGNTSSGAPYRTAIIQTNGFNITRNNETIMNLVPVQRSTDGEIGMYDTVTGTFFTKTGSGTFIAGPEVITSCTNVGAGYYAPASTVNYGSAGTRTACASGLTTVGYGHGADSANDCAHTLHIGEGVVYMRRNKETSPALHIQMENGDIFYINLGLNNHNMSKIHFWHNGAEYTAYDDSLFYGERNF